MACFTACLAEGFAVYLLRGRLRAHHHAPALEHKLGSLQTMLLGGSALLLIEHIWHGEISAVFPFFTRAQSSEGLNEMLHEILTVGVGMDLLVTAGWGLGLLITGLVSRSMENKTCA
ncbi:MAG: hypothetical protein K6F05_07245 [Succinivibrio sp.]|nr:hypothetical protein [Succinivibrio sp.]